MRVVISPQARDDLRSIAAYIARDDPRRATSFIDELREACRDLSDYPRRFPVFLPGGADTHCRNHGNYLIIYAVDKRVDVLTIVHGARDLGSLF